MTNFAIYIIGRVPAYASFILSVLAIFATYLSPSLAPQTPVRQNLIIKPRRSSINSLKSSTSTLVGSAHDDKRVLKSEKRGRKSDSKKLKTPKTPLAHFSELTAPIIKAAKTQSEAIHPFVRRLSMPARCFSANLMRPFTHTGALVNGNINEEGDSYFPSPNKFDADTQVSHASQVEVVEQQPCAQEVKVASASPKRLLRFRRAATKLRAAIRISHHSA